MRTISGGAVRPIRILPPVLRTEFLHYNRGKIRRAGNHYPGPSHRTSHGSHRGYRAWPQHPPGIPARGPSEIFARLVRIHPPLDSPDRLSPDRQPHHLLVHPFLPPLCRRGADRGRGVSPGRGCGGGVSAKPLSAILESILVDALGLPAAAIQVRLLRSWGEIVGPLLDGKTSPGKIRNGVLTVFVPHPAGGPELQPAQPVLLEKIRCVAGEGKVREIRFTVGSGNCLPVAPPDEAAPTRGEKGPPPPGGDARPDDV